MEDHVQYLQPHQPLGPFFIFLTFLPPGSNAARTKQAADWLESMWCGAPVNTSQGFKNQSQFCRTDSVALRSHGTHWPGVSVAGTWRLSMQLQQAWHSHMTVGDASSDLGVGEERFTEFSLCVYCWQHLLLFWKMEGERDLDEWKIKVNCELNVL